MQCIGRTKQRKRCRRDGNAWLWPLCHQHQFQPVAAAIMLLGLVGSVASLRSWNPQETKKAIQYRNESQLWQSEVEQYLADQVLQRDLDQRYEFGYAVLDVRGRNRSLTVPQSRGIQANWSSARLVSYASDHIEILLPDLSGQGFQTRSTKAVIAREPGFRLGVFVFADAVLYVECLRNAPAGVLAVVGVAAQTIAE